MFTEFKMAKWNYMFLTALASLAVAAVATFICTRTAGQSRDRATQEIRQVNINGDFSLTTETTLKFVN
jgi:cytochrome oxidase Cu insertion factor (SCO1/SenC/PrrC family)